MRNGVCWLISSIVGVSIGLSLAATLTADTSANSSSGYEILKRIPLSDEGTWDYLTIDTESRRLYVSRETHVLVLNLDTGAIEGNIPDTQGVHGIALAPEFGRGFTSNGRSNTVTIFDIKTLKTLSTVKTGNDPDSIVYDGVSKLVFVTNEHSKSVTAIKAVDGTVAATIPLADEPEAVITDDQGYIYVNLDDPAEVAVIDVTKLTVAKRIPLPKCTEPTALAMDRKNHRLFASCRNETMAVVNVEDGKLVARVPIGRKVDGVAFDPGSQLVFSSNGVGTLTIIHQDTPDQYSVVDTVQTMSGARTMALDPTTHRIYLVGAYFLPNAKGEKELKVKPGSAMIIVVGK